MSQLNYTQPVSKNLFATILALIVWGIGAIYSCTLANPPPNTLAQAMEALQTSQANWLEVDLSEQKLVVWQGKQPTYATIISTGKASTPTQPGVFTIQSKLLSDRMRGSDYDIPDVPYVMYYNGGYAIHGAYWHNNFGIPISHGCINLPVNQAQWLFQWAEIGTTLVIHP